MSGVKTNSHGWPYFADDGDVYLTPKYTRDLANKLEKSDAQAAANSAERAEAAAARVGTSRAAGVETITTTATASQNYLVPLPAGRFSVTPVLSVNAVGTAVVAVLHGTMSKDSFYITLRPSTGSTLPAGGQVKVHWLAIQMTPTRADG